MAAVRRDEGQTQWQQFNVTEERREIMKNRHKNFKTWESLNEVLKY